MGPNLEMESELNRIATYRDCIVATACTIRLACIGLYYNVKSEQIVCFSCELNLNPAQSFVECDKRHRTLSSHCAFLNGGDNRNVSLKIEPWCEGKDEVSKEGTPLLANKGSIDCNDSGISCSVGFDTKHFCSASVADCTAVNKLRVDNESINDSSRFHCNLLNEAIRSSAIYQVYVEARVRAEKRDVFTNSPNASHRSKFHSCSEPAFEKEIDKCNDLENEPVVSINQAAASIKQLAAQDSTVPPTIAESIGQAPVTNQTSASSRDSFSFNYPTHLTPSATTFHVNRQNPTSEDYELLTRESVRLSTYHNWPPTAKVRPPELARAGLFYSGYSDRVQCAFCREYLRNWEVGDDPVVEHNRHFSNCPLARKTANNILDVSNHPQGQTHPSSLLHEDQFPSETALTRQNDSIPSETSETSSGGLYLTGSDDEEDQDLMINGLQAKSPAYVSERGRVESFTGKIIAAGKTPEILAKAGFYHSGPYDNVRCFFCDGGLKNWQAEDDAWTEHARWFPRCQYVGKYKSAEFIQEVQIPRTLTLRQNLPEGSYAPPPLPAQTVPATTARPANAPQGQASSTGNGSSATAAGPFTFDRREIRARLDTPTARALMGMGYREDLIRTTIEKRMAAMGDDFVNTEGLLEAVLQLEAQLAVEDQLNGTTTAQGASSGVGTRVNTTTTTAVTPGVATRRDAVNQAPANTPASAATTTTTTTTGSATGGAARATGGAAGGATGGATSSPATGGATGSSKSKKKRNKNKKKEAAAAAAALARNVSQNEGGATEAPGHDDTQNSSPAVGNQEEREQERDLQTEAQSLIEENRQLKDQRTCRICMDKEVNTVFLTCGHLICCQDCAQEMRHCPICRGLIRGTVKTFMS